MERGRERGFDVQHGQFGADMQVESVNDGPVTILFDTENLKRHYLNASAIGDHR